jgi:hypothetical protein
MKKPEKKCPECKKPMSQCKCKKGGKGKVPTPKVKGPGGQGSDWK